MCLWCYSECISTPGKLKNLRDHGGNQTRDLWFIRPMLSQLTYEVKSVRVCDTSELSLVPSISVFLYYVYDFRVVFLVLCTQLYRMCFVHGVKKIRVPMCYSLQIAVKLVNFFRCKIGKQIK